MHWSEKWYQITCYKLALKTIQQDNRALLPTSTDPTQLRIDFLSRRSGPSRCSQRTRLAVTSTPFKTPVFGIIHSSAPEALQKKSRVMQSSQVYNFAERSSCNWMARITFVCWCFLIAFSLPYHCTISATFQKLGKCQHGPTVTRSTTWTRFSLIGRLSMQSNHQAGD